VLDRVFEPSRYGQAAQPALPLPPPTPPRPVPQAAAEPEPLAGQMPDPAPAQVKDPDPVPDTLVTAEPLPEPAAATPAPRRDPALRIAALLRDNPWLTRFWGELDGNQQGRVRRALARRGMGGPDPAARWDPMGLDDRTRLVFGDGT
jgi:hypothetical protein